MDLSHSIVHELLIPLPKCTLAIFYCGLTMNSVYIRMFAFVCFHPEDRLLLLIASSRFELLRMYSAEKPSSWLRVYTVL